MSLIDQTASPQACCPEFAAFSRRSLLRGALVLGGMTVMVGSATVSASASSLTPATAVLVVLSLRGGADGLSLVVPHGDPGYYQARPTIAVPANELLAADSLFGLHPRLAPLLSLWNGGHVAAIHATGLTSANRSHFSAMEEVEEALPGSHTRMGWLNRLVGSANGGSPLRGVGIVGGPPSTALAGPVPLMTVNSLDNATIAGDDQDDIDPPHKRRDSLTTLWANDPSPMGVGVRSTLQATLDITPAISEPDNSAAYGGSDLGNALATAARIIRADIGTQVLTVDQGNWDMHVNLGDLHDGQMLTNAGNLATAITAFFDDLADQASKVTLVTISEFGRRTVENDNRGLDHGWGNVMFVAGAGVNGGYYVNPAQGWQPLANDLESDLQVTTDYRNVLAEIVTARFGAPISTVFPGLQQQNLGFMRP